MKWRSAFLWLSAFGVALLLTLAFLRAEQVRQPIFGRYPAPGDNTWRINLTAALDLTRYWHQEGFLQSGMIPRFHAPSVSNPYSGSNYLSYPPLFILAPLAFAYATGKPPDLEALTKVSIFSHCAMAVLAALFVFIAAQGCGTDAIPALWLGGISGSLSLLVPASLIYFPFGWWADMAGLPFFAAMVALEAWAPRWGGSKNFRLFQACLAFMGVFADWLFVLLLGALFLKDLTAQVRKIRWEFLAAPFVYGCYHVYLVASSGTWKDFSQKVLLRSGISHQNTPFTSGLASWQEILLKGLGENGYYLYLLTLAALPILLFAFFLRRRLSEKLRTWVELCFLMVVPMFLHSFLLRQHYYHHTYNAVKFALQISVVWFGLLPALASFLNKRLAPQYLAVALSFYGAVAYAKSFHPVYANFFASPLNLNSTLERYCQILYRNSARSAIHFSADFATHMLSGSPAPAPELPISTWGVAACGNPVYLSRSPADFPLYYLENRWNLRLVGVNFQLLLWSLGPPAKIWQNYIIAGSRQKIGELEVHELSKNILTHGI